MIDTAWELGGLAQYDALNLRRWAHMLGFRGHFLTKSRAYSITFTASAHERRTWRLRSDLAQLAADTDDPGNDVPLDLDTVTVINDWRRHPHRPPRPRRTRTRTGHRRTQPHPTTHHPNQEGSRMTAADLTRPVRLMLTVEEAAERLGIGRTLMYALITSGRGRVSTHRTPPPRTG